MKRFAALTLMALASFSAFGQGLTPKQAFDQLKKLTGTWEMGAGDQKFQVIYKVSGAGSAVFETQFAGQAHEMVSVYHMDGDKLIMTHYCAAGNQPTLVYKPGKDPKVLSFGFLRATNLKSKDVHIHGARIVFQGPEKLKSDWIGYANGKPMGTTTFDLKKVAPADAIK